MADGALFPAVAPPAPPAEVGPGLETYRRLFTEARDGTQTARLNAKTHRRYYDGKQWSEEEKAAKRSRREPAFAINRVRPGVEGMVGVVERGKSDPRAYPRNPQDENASEVATDTLRYVADINRWHQDKLKGFRNMLVEGTAAAIVEVDAKLEVRIRRIRFEEFFYDPHSREPDFSDASYMGCAKWQYVADVAAVYPEFADRLRDACDNGDYGDDTWADRPTSTFGAAWSDSRRKRLLVVEMYHQFGGQWLKCVFVGALKLEAGPSPYHDGDGQPCNPIEAVSAYVDDENNRYGVVADMIGPQDEINVYRTKAAWRATWNQLQESDNASESADPEDARKEAAKPDGVIPRGWQLVPTDGKFSMDMALLAEAKAEIERIGPNPAILGRQAENASGRAALIRQQAGLTELAHLFGGLEDWELRIYRQAWARIRQFWTAPKFIRVTDDEQAVKFIQINEPVWGEPVPVIDPMTGLPQYDATTRQIVMRPQLLGVRNAVAEMGVDIIIDSTPDTANVAQEQWSQLVELAKMGALGRDPGPMLLESSSLPKKRVLLEKLKAGTQQQASPGAQPGADPNAPPGPPAGAPPQPPGPPPELVRLELAERAAGIDKTQAQADEARARATKAMGEARRNEMSTRWMGPVQPPPPGQGF